MSFKRGMGVKRTMGLGKALHKNLGLRFEARKGERIFINAPLAVKLGIPPLEKYYIYDRIDGIVYIEMQSCSLCPLSLELMYESQNEWRFEI